MESIPAWAGKYLEADSHQAVAVAISQAEKKTSGEIVAMVVRQSSATGHVPVIVSGLAFLSFLALDFLVPRASWLSHTRAGLVVPALLDALLAVFAGEALSFWDPIRRWLTSRHDRMAQVHQRALLEFHMAGLEKTKGATGVLIFVSIMERQVVVLADKGIAGKLPPETWKDVVSLALEGIKAGGLGQGLAAAVGRCGELLQPHFPIQPGDTNEIPNRLIVKE